MVELLQLNVTMLCGKIRCSVVLFRFVPTRELKQIIISIQTGTQASKIIQSSARVQRMSEEVHKAPNHGL